jgi:5'(3')-deoxyribonucleotidase
VTLPRLGIDVDEVVAQLHEAWLARYNAEYHEDITPDHIMGWDIHEYCLEENRIYDFLTPGIYSEITPFPGSVVSLEIIRSLGYNLTFVTNCGPQHQFAEEKQAWLASYGLFDSTKDGFISTRQKHLAPVDILIDDYTKNVMDFESGGKVSMLVTRPHNLLDNWNGIRIGNLAGAIPLLQRLATSVRDGALRATGQHPRRIPPPAFSLR